MSKCREDRCTDSLRCNVDKILAYIGELKKHRDDINHILRLQEGEKMQTTVELERLSYKMNLLSKSMAQRIITRNRYNEAIFEAEEYYNKLIESSGHLLEAIKKDYHELFESMDKKVGTEGAKDVCGEPCHAAQPVECLDLNNL